jgi:hypothetical protein
MAGIVLEISVDDKGTPKIKQFSDEAKKAFKEMTEAPRQTQGVLASLRDSWVGLTAKVAVATGIFYAAKRMIYDTAMQIASATNDIERQAAVLGISTDEFQKWQYAAKMSDVNAQELAIGIKLLSRNMEDAASGSGDAAKYFSAMGVSVKTTEGNLRPLNDVMGDIMDKFASWEEGPRKIAIAMQLFGRSGETLIPLLNKGRTGFNELAAEAQKLGIILSPELIRKGSEAEDIFKKINAQLEAGKLKMADYALPVAKFVNSFLDALNKIKNWTEENPNIWRFIVGIMPGGAAISAKLEIDKIKKTAESLRAEALMAWEPGATPIPKKEPPGTIGFLKKEEIEKDVLVFRQLVAEAERLSEFGGMPDWREFIEYTPKRALPDIIQLNLELNKLVAEAERLSEFGDMPDWREFIEYTPKRALPDIIQLNLELNKLIAEAENLSNKGKMPSWLDALEESMGIGQAQWRKNITEMDTIWNSFAQNISSVWSENVSGMIKGTEKFSDAFKNLIKGIEDAFISTVSKMITQWLLFGSVTGKKESGGGWLTGGMWSGIFGFLRGLQTGGIVTRPTPALIGEGGPEAVVPLKEGRIPVESSEPKIQIINNIWTNDLDSFRRYVLANRDLFEGISLGAYSEAKRLNKINFR